MLDLDSASIVVSSGSGSERVVHVYPDRADRTSSGGSTSARSPTSSGGSFGSEESWSEVEYDDDEIDPSDSASRSRHPHSRRHTVEAPAPSRRHSSHRRVVEVERDELPPRRHSSRRHHSSRHDSSHSRHRRRDSSRRVPSDESSSTVASHDDYPPYGHHGMPRAAYPPMGGYSRPPQSHGGYPPSMTSAGYPDPYAPPHQALVHMQRQDPFGYPQPNPFAPQSQAPNPFSPISSHEGSSYFATDPMGPPPPRPHRPEGPPRPQSFAAPSAYPGSELMAPYHGGMPPYGHFGMPGYPPYPPIAGWPASNSSSPPPKEDRSIAEIEALKEMIKQKYNDDAKKKEEKTSEIDDLKKLIKKHEEEAVARQKAWAAEKEAEAAARAAEKAKIEEEKKRKQEIADAQKKAKEDAEKKAEEAAKKAKDEHEKKLAEAEKAREDADKAKKALEEEMAKSKPSPDSAKAPIRFKDAVGRKFSFPWPYCKTWKGMENLIKQAFLHVDVIGDHVHQGHYDLTGPDGEIILPQVWDIVVQPDWEVTMHLWPMEEEKKKSPDIDSMIDPFGGMGLGGMPNFGDLGMIPEVGGPGIKKSKSGKKGDGSKKKKAGGGSPEAMIVNPSMPPPPPHHGMPPPPGGGYGDPFAPYGGGFPPMPMPEKEKKGSSKPRSNSKRSKDISPLQAWFAGGSMNAKAAKKK
ncbi:hypothetical protein M409DRAFT_65289 [Zasmidium cellare ATCC 36951]|uniref:Ubiquitin-like domain-containing protein n=1 Tax=Zasmidium cellare ATCC 36951 TaxID=1080233 RepID=A0A6A6CS26_ZASCE|nr:uncharacterized protein M409DRAFT_65289 [Zasmidium cellare ATCC 36951]KAF2168950.1 hypothetical protein M409DRAFT_65289 [Zasmidium cellare ATCC 36951]